MNASTNGTHAPDGAVNRVAATATAQDAKADNVGVLERVRQAMVEDELSQVRAAALIGVGKVLFNRWFNGNYDGDNAKVERKAIAWLRQRGEKIEMAALLPDCPTWFESETSSRIISHLRYAHTLGDMVSVFGVPGVGKTSALRYYQSTYPNVWIATMSPAVTKVVPVLQQVCDAVGAIKSNGARLLTSAIRTKVRHTQGILIIDEAHFLEPLALDELRSLHDELGISIALVGDVSLDAKIQAMPQLHSRVGLKLFVTKVLGADIEALLDAWVVKDHTSRVLLTKVARKPGALREVTKVLRFASTIASAANEKLDTTHIRDAIAARSNVVTGEE